MTELAYDAPVGANRPFFWEGFNIQGQAVQNQLGR